MVITGKLKYLNKTYPTWFTTDAMLTGMRLNLGLGLHCKRQVANHLSHGMTWSDLVKDKSWIWNGVRDGITRVVAASLFMKVVGLFILL
jgi:hypothetical protein